MAAGSTMVGMRGALSTRGGGARRPMAKGGKQGFDPATGKKVFGREFRSGFKMARAAGMHKGENAPRAAQMRNRLTALDAGTIQGKPGEKSFLRGVMHGARGGGGGG